MNTRASDIQTTLKFQKIPTCIARGEPNCIADRMHMVLHADHIRGLNDAIVSVFDNQHQMTFVLKK